MPQSEDPDIKLTYDRDGLIRKIIIESYEKNRRDIQQTRFDCYYTIKVVMKDPINLNQFNDIFNRELKTMVESGLVSCDWGEKTEFFYNQKEEKEIMRGIESKVKF